MQATARFHIGGVFTPRRATTAGGAMRVALLLHTLLAVLVLSKKDSHGDKGKTEWDTPGEGKKVWDQKPGEGKTVWDKPGEGRKGEDKAPPVVPATITTVWDPSGPVQSQLGGLFELLRPPLPPFRRLVDVLSPKRALELGAAESRMLMAAMLLLQTHSKEGKVCGAGINSLAYKFGTDKMPEKSLHGGEAIWWGVMKRDDFATIARSIGLPMPIETPHHIHDDLFSATGGVPFQAGAADLLYSQASLDKWRHYPMSYSGWNASTTIKRMFGEPEVVASTERVCADMARVMRVGGTVHVQITTTMFYNATILQGLMSSLPKPSFDGTMLPVLMAFGTMPATTAEDLESTRINEFAHATKPGGSRPHHIEEAPTKLHQVCHEPEVVDEPKLVGTERCVAALYYLTSVPASAFKTTSFSRGGRLWTSQNLMLFVHSYPAPPAGIRCEDALPPILKETIPPLREVMTLAESSGGSAATESDKSTFHKLVKKFRWALPVQIGVLNWMSKLGGARVYDLHGISSLRMPSPKKPQA